MGPLIVHLNYETVDPVSHTGITHNYLAAK